MSVTLSAWRSSIKHVLGQLVGGQALGMIDYARFPQRGAEWGGPFNGQRFRQELYLKLIDRIAPVAIVETGTYLGTTTEFMAESGLPIFTVEGNPRNYGFARARLWRRRNVKLLLGDSRAGLRTLIDEQLTDLADQMLFFYLDAHWNDDLPLIEELDIVFERCSNAVVMVDDFQVPFDAGYAYDDYGPGRTLAPAYIESIASNYRLQTFYPSVPSHNESGARRGCVVLAKWDVGNSKLASMPQLRFVTKTELSSARI